MTDFGWSYPPGCNGIPDDDVEFEHEDDCECPECSEIRREADEKHTERVWRAEQAASERADNLMDGALSEDDDAK